MNEYKINITEHELYSFWENLRPEPDIDRFKKLLEDHPLVNSLPYLGKAGLFIIDFSTLSYVYFSKSFQELTGYDPELYYKDGWQFALPRLLDKYKRFAFEFAYEFMFRYLASVPAEQQREVVFSKDYVFMSGDGLPHRYLQQTSILENDANGKIWLTVNLVMIIDHLKKDDAANFVISRKGMQSELYSFDAVAQTVRECGSFSEREMEVLRLLRSGMESKAIAAKLGISAHTVDTHRRNLLGKTNTRDTSALVTYCSLTGIL